MDNLVRRHGIPVSIYQDRHGSLPRNDDHWTLEEPLAGPQDLTQVGQALAALGIQPIFALSPEAKGRIERLFGTLQGRLVAEMSLAASRPSPRPMPSRNRPLSGLLTDVLRSFPPGPKRPGDPCRQGSTSEE